MHFVEKIMKKYQNDRHRKVTSPQQRNLNAKPTMLTLLCRENQGLTTEGKNGRGEKRGVVLGLCVVG